jgi:hypothetical protein
MPGIVAGDMHIGQVEIPHRWAGGS